MFYTIDLRKIKFRSLIAMGILGVIIFMLLLTLIRVMFYPTKYKEIVHKYAIQYELNPYLVFSVIKAESKFNTLAKSHRGAKGLMQITDQTGEWAAQEIGIEDYNPEKLYDPEINIQIGCWYLKKLLVQYNYNIETSLAAYNAGSGNVSKWLRDDDYSEDGERIYEIPFKETREYVEKVIKSIKRYEKFYKKSVE